MSLGTSVPDLNNDAFAKFDRMREKVEMAEAEADALRELSGESVPADISRRTRNAKLEIHAEPRELKSKTQEEAKSWPRLSARCT